MRVYANTRRKFVKNTQQEDVFLGVCVAHRSAAGNNYFNPGKLGRERCDIDRVSEKSMYYIDIVFFQIVRIISFQLAIPVLWQMPSGNSCAIKRKE